MALITKIRRNFWFVLLLIGFALAAFLIMDVTSGPMGGNGQADLTLGMVNGKKISYQDYQIAEGAYYRGNTGDIYAKRASIWDFFVEQAIVNDVANDVGVNVSQQELMELQFGPNTSPIILQNWANQQQQLAQIKAQIENDEEMNVEFRQYWAEQEKQIVKAKKQDKIASMVSKAIYSPSWMAQESFKDDNTKVDFNYVKIPFDQITEEVTLSDADYKSYMTKNADQFTSSEETRVIQYATFDVVASEQDSADILAQSNTLLANWKETDSDSSFVLTNGGVYQNAYFKMENLPEKMKEVIGGMEDGSYYGPYVEAGRYNMFKLIDAKNVPDTVSAQHILRNADKNNTIQVAAANKYIDSLLNRYNRGLESFDTLAVKNSQDASNAFKGGDLGEFTQGTMVPEFNDVCFLTGKPGNVYKVQTDYGIHLINLKKQKYSDDDDEYKVALLSKPIVPSETTQNVMFDKVSDVILENRDIDALNAALAEEGIVLTTSGPLKQNDYTLPVLGGGQSSRDIIRWAFDPTAEVGDVSTDLYSYQDAVNYYDNKYVVAALKSINPAGMQPVDAVRSIIEPQVMNQKKAEVFTSKMSITSLEDLAATYNVEVATSNNSSLGSPFIEGLGSEADVVAVAYATDVQAISKPIIGKSGVYVVQPLSKSEAGEAVNIPSIKSNISTTMKSQVAFRLMESLKKAAKIDDKRFDYF